MWTAKLLRKKRDGYRITLFFEFTNGTDTFVDELYFNYTQNLDTIKRELYRRIQYLNSVDTLESDIASGTITPEAPPPVVVDPPPAITPEEQAQEDYKLKVLQMRGIYNAIQYGVLTGTEPLITTVRNYLKNNFKPEYITFY